MGEVALARKRAEGGVHLSEPTYRKVFTLGDFNQRVFSRGIERFIGIGENFTRTTRKDNDSALLGASVLFRVTQIELHS